MISMVDLTLAAAAVAAAAALVLLLFAAFLYNTLVSLRNQARNSFSGVDVMLKRRYDLIPNLVAAVKGYMEHERGVLTEITEIRSKAMSPDASAADKIKADGIFTSLLHSIMVSVENYPQLKASDNFMNLQAALADAEEQISAARRAYNAAVLDYNNAVEMLPTSIVAGLLNFRRMEFFETAPPERLAPKSPESLNKAPAER
ncbi:MAG: LemA family protein [Candidatus Altiarchaeota archaeon]|nr:LemA family protein [Candidatus Altiarchaeota archaeon]